MNRNKGKIWKLVLAFTLSLGIISANASTVAANEVEADVPATTLEETPRRHFRSGPNNDNKVNPALLKNESPEVEGLKDGSIELNYTPLSTKTDTRFGVYVKYIDENNFVFVGADNSSNWFYEYKVDGAGSYPGLSVSAPEQGEDTSLSIAWKGNNLFISINGQPTNGGNPYIVDALASLESAPLRLKAATFGKAQTDVLFSDVVIKNGDNVVLNENGNDEWSLTGTTVGALYEFAFAPKAVDVKGTIVDEEGNPIDNAVVTIDPKSVKTNSAGEFIFTEIATGEYRMSIQKPGFLKQDISVVVSESNIELNTITLLKEKNVDEEADITLTTNQMRVGLDESFPRVVFYEMNGNKMYGQTQVLDSIKVNGIEVKPNVTSTVNSSSIDYIMEVVDTQNGIDATINASIIVNENIIEFKITSVDDRKIVKTIEISDHSLVSVRSNQAGASFAGAQMSTNTHRSGDTFKAVSEMKDGVAGYMFANINTDKLAAAVWSNSENNVTADWQRISATTKTYENYKTVGLGSTYWTHQKGPEYKKENSEEELPIARVVITEDINEDSIVDWQDAAVASRTIIQAPKGADTVPDQVAMRIAMNFGSQAQNPFLVTADNMKKINLHTDGLGQMVLLKGYGSEGHDSGHLNYADIGQRIGGTEDMKALLDMGQEYGTLFGIHVNASETYPESKYFQPSRLKKNADGSYSYGWNWIDQGINIDANYDLLNGRRDRFVDLYNELGGEDNNLDFIYVDVWGNGQSGDNGTWASSQLAKEIKSLGWRVSGEWGYAFAYDSTFQHWAADLTYGGYALKGINSDIARFIQNHQKDSWAGDFESYGGAANNPLLGGYDMKDFEGWQGRSDYGGYIENLFDDNIPSKYVQHFEVTNWKNGTPVQMSDNGESYSWTPEMEIGLKDADTGSKLVIQRQSNDVKSPGYRLRTMTLDGKVIMNGEKYLIPWLWNESGDSLATADQKLYHWNQAGGTSIWNVPSDWSGNVVLYELSEDGKINPQNVPIIDGQVSINAKAKTPYVLHRAESTNKDVTWSEGMHIVDTGFNSGKLDNWTIEGESTGAKVDISQANNRMLVLENRSDEVKLTQTMTDLIAGQNYAVYVGVDNRSDSKAYLEVSANGKVESNYTEKSIAKNYIKAYGHNNNNATVSKTSYFQNMYVFFTAPSDGSDVTISLRREPGAGTTYFDDIRIFENESKMFKDDITFEQNFEHTPQGVFPFVIGGVEGVEDNRTHLSQKNAPYTQAGWNNKVVNDVIDGDWSLKTNGLTNRSKMLYQTIPQNYRFEPGVTYNISFDYEMGTENAYTLVIGNGEYNGKVETIALDSTITDSKANTAKFRITGAENGQTWFGIYSANTPTDGQGMTGGAKDFAGYGDFVLDNVTIVKTSVDITALQKLINDNSNLYEVNYTASSWSTFSKELSNAKEKVEDFYLTQDQADSAYSSLLNAVSSLEKTASVVSGTIKDIDGNAISGASVILTQNGKVLTTTTNAKGEYFIAGALFGEHKISVNHSYFKEVSETITTTLEESVLVKDYTLENATSKLTGLVSAVGQPLAGIRVKLESDNNTYETTTDENGNYTLDNVISGYYQITAAHTMKGYDVYKSETSIVKDIINTKNIMIEPESKLDYFNDFSTSTTWENLAGNTSSTTIKWVDGQTQVKFPGGHANVYDAAAPRFKNGVVEMDITPIKDSARLGIILRANDMNNRVYVGTLENSESWFVEHWGKGGNSWSGGHQGPGIKANQKVHLKVEIVDRTVKLWVNDTFVLEETMGSMQLEAGSIGLNTRNTNEVLVDNVSVVSYDAPFGDLEHVVGHISNEGNPVSGVDVKIESKSDAKISNLFGILSSDEAVSKIVKSDANGNYKFKNMPYGNYLVSATDSSGKTVTKDVIVKAVDGYIVVDEIKFDEVVPTVDKTKLETLIADADKLIKDDYTSDSWAIFKDAIDSAKIVLTSDSTTQGDVNAAHTTLSNAMNSLVKLDKVALRNAISEASRLVKDDYTSESWTKFIKAYNDAVIVLNEENTSQKKIDSALTELNTQIEALVKVEAVDKTMLDEAINKAKALDEAKYTNETWNLVKKALDSAITIQEDAKSTQQQIDDAEMSLHSAINGLVLNDASTVKPVDPKDKNSESPTTGIKQNAAVWTGLVALSLLGLIVIKQKRKREQ